MMPTIQNIARELDVSRDVDFAAIAISSPPRKKPCGAGATLPSGRYVPHGVYLWPDWAYWMHNGGVNVLVCNSYVERRGQNDSDLNATDDRLWSGEQASTHA